MQASPVRSISIKDQTETWPTRVIQQQMQPALVPNSKTWLNCCTSSNVVLVNVVLVNMQRGVGRKTSHFSHHQHFQTSI
jgi:hypothetical protein